MASAGSRVAQGMQSSLLGQGAVLALSLLLTPVIVHRLDADGYALYSLMWTLLGYLQMLNLGTGVATQKYTTAWTARGERDRLGTLLRLCLAFQIGAGLLGSALLYFFSSALAEKLLVNPALRETAVKVFVCVALTAPAYFVVQFGAAVLYGMQWFGMYNLFQAALATLPAALAAFLLTQGRGLREVAAAFFAAHALLALNCLWLIRRVLAARGELQSDDVSEFAHFSGKTFLSQVLWWLKFQGDRAFLGAMLPLSQLGYYVVSASIAQKFNSVFGSVSFGALPVITELHSRGERERLRHVYLKSAQLTWFIVLPMTILSFAFVPQFMTLWLGEQFSRAGTWPFRLLCIANLSYVATYLPNALAIAQGAPHLLGGLLGAQVALLLLCWPKLIASWGIAGAAAGMAAVEVLCVPVFVEYVQRRYVGLAAGEYFLKACLKPFAVGAATAAAAFACHGAAGSWASLIALSAACGGLYGALSFAVIGGEDRKRLIDWFKVRVGA